MPEKRPLRFFEKLAIWPTFWYGWILFVTGIYCVHIWRNPEPNHAEKDYVSRLGGVICFLALALSNRPMIRKAFPQPDLTGEAATQYEEAAEVLDRQAIKWGLVLTGLGTFLWAVGDWFYGLIPQLYDLLLHYFKG